MMKIIANLLFNYLGDILYDPENAKLDLDVLPEEFQRLGKGMQYFAKCLGETQIFTKALSEGDLSTPLPSRDNLLAAPIKSLHAALRHMTWQSQQVAKGDYQQRLEFLGDFADSFNTMTEQLAKRQESLEQSNHLFQAITEVSSLWIFVLDKRSGERVFTNQAAKKVLEEDADFSEPLRNWLNSPGLVQTEPEEELALRAENKSIILSVHVYPIQWHQEEAIAYVLQDISTEKKQVYKLENAAYKDNLTQLYTRYYGMKILQKWLDENRHFSVCFIDIDNLKYVNDRYGHAEGDRYILTVSQEIQNFSEDAVICRLGGDEFMLLAPDRNRTQTEARMDILCSQLKTAHNCPASTEYLHSISYGVAEVDINTDLYISEILRLADERMYIYKRANRPVYRNP